MGIQKIGHRIFNCSKSAYPFKSAAKEWEDSPCFGFDFEDDPDDCDLEESSCEISMVEGELCSIPYDLYGLPNLREILSLDTWNSCLTEKERLYLSAYLPDMDQQTFQWTMKELLGGSDMLFGNPVDTFFKRLKGGFYPPKVACLRQGLLFLQKKMYYHSLRSHHTKMIKMFIEMRNIWDLCDRSPGVEERISIWKKRRKQRDAYLLDLNKFPKDDNVLNKEVNLDLRELKSLQTEGIKDNLHGVSANFKRYVGKTCLAKGVWKVNPHVNSSVRIHNPVNGALRSVPKGVLKILPKVPSYPEVQSAELLRAARQDFLIKTQGVTGFQFSALPAYVHLPGASALYESHLWQKIDGRSEHSTLNQSHCVLNQQDSVAGTINAPESSTKKVKKDAHSDVSIPVECKMIGGDVGIHLANKYELSMDPVYAGMPVFSGKEFWLNMSTGSSDFPLKCFELHPFDTQYRGGEQCLAPTKNEFISSQAKITQAVPRMSDIGHGEEEKIMTSSLDQLTGNSNCTNVRESKQLLGKSSLSRGFKDGTVPPLTYKRRKVLSKVNPSDSNKTLTMREDLISAVPEEPNQHLNEGAKAMNVKFTC
ncbi:hypothetical protein K2173_004909 [Erythroxylum novogranatense]|uniref:DEUBAD domain-containing protein n=1 Tax=Erythroxylum novogranatense TaxID=1862640 RepID=A0AAV8UBV4_9ROSI|nr:hypothetical protein K2173_004909 [Erythroxylum novogranatense]